MKEGRLHIRVNKDLLDAAKAMSKRKGLTLTEVVEDSLRNFLQEDSVGSDMNVETTIGVSQL